MITNFGLESYFFDTIPIYIMRIFQILMPICYGYSAVDLTGLSGVQLEKIGPQSCKTCLIGAPSVMMDEFTYMLKISSLFS